MDRHLKERVVGAVVVIIAAVIFVPMLLDGQPGETNNETKLPLPPQSIHARRVEMFDTQKSALPNESINKLQSSGAEASSDQKTELTADTLVEVPSAAKEQKTQTTKTATPSLPVAESHKSKDREGSEQGAIASDVTSGWVVQVGSFRDQANAQRLVDDLKKLSYPAFITRHSGADYVFYRVRVGPEADRDRAGVLAGRLKKEGQVVAVVPFP